VHPQAKKPAKAALHRPERGSTNAHDREVRQALTLVLNGGIGRSESVPDKKAENMNPERIYQQHREDALRGQIEAAKYSTFVAMPFRDSFSYKSKTVYKEIIQKAAEVASSKKTARLEFDVPKRVDDASGQAVVITEE
jgi:hypothetical protein